MLGKTLLKLYVIIFNFCFYCFSAQAQKYDFTVKMVLEPYLLTGASARDISHSLFLTLDQTWQSTDKNNRISAQINFNNNSYNINEVKYQLNEIFPGELYYERVQSFQRLILGYQYLHFVDGFDTLGMESLNPENLNLSFFSKSYMRYRTVPALNYKLIFNSISFQFINVFQSKTNSDNIYLLDQFIKQSNLTYNGDPQEGKFFKRSDYGIRLLGTLSLFDWSVYYLSVFDKVPVYIFDLTQLTVTKTQLPYKSYGGNFTFDLSSNILRFDYKFNDQRSFLSKNLLIEKTNEILLNLSYEPPEFSDYRISFNYSHSELSKNIEYLSRNRKIQDVYIRVAKKINADFSWNSLLLQRVSDSGYAAQLEIENNISKSHDIRFGAEYFSNKENTGFGVLKDFSRVYIGINAYTSN